MLFQYAAPRLVESKHRVLLCLPLFLSPFSAPPPLTPSWASIGDWKWSSTVQLAVSWSGSASPHPLPPLRDPSPSTTTSTSTSTTSSSSPTPPHGTDSHSPTCINTQNPFRKPPTQIPHFQAASLTADNLAISWA